MKLSFHLLLLPLLVAAQPTPPEGPPAAANYFATSNCSKQVCVDGSYAAYLPGRTSQQCLEKCSEGYHGFKGIEIGACTHFSFGANICVLYTSCATLESNASITVGSGFAKQVITDSSLFTTCLVPWAPPPPSADWVLISSQDRGKKAFGGNVRNTFVQDSANPESGAYMIIGLLNKDELKNEEGKYHFKLVNFDGAEADGDVLEWKQTSWLRDDRPSGTVAISPNLMSGNGCTGFRGLAKSNNGAAVMDGDGYAGGCWWNCVGNIHKYGHGFPANNGQIKGKYTLYIWADPKIASQ